MSDAVTVPTTIPSEPGTDVPTLQLIGAADVDACVGEFCELPAHREQAVMNRRVDSDEI